jgi:hypothetical protein
LNDVLDEYHFQMTTSYPNLSPFHDYVTTKNKGNGEIVKTKEMAKFQVVLFVCFIYKESRPINDANLRPVRLNLSSWLISHGTMFFTHNKSVSAGLSAAKTISRTAR